MLTRGFGDENERQKQATRPGMAHFAGTGPIGATCASCRYREGGSRLAELGPHAVVKIGCSMYRRLMKIKPDAKVPTFNSSTPACRHYAKRVQ